ncbi:hypothetical protein D5086_022821 [Populus alba]|uniref:Uncharacterized protein n=1 Tax=Populus alba TaxID=43335 RepID=A0ACC4B8Q2_POPAL
MFPELKWYYVVVAYILAPSLSFCNAYGAGLTDMNMAYNYGKVALFLLASLAGKNNGVVAGLVGCGLIKSIVSISSDLMHDFKTGHLTLTSPRSMLLSQAIGTVIGCVVAPVTFFLFYKAFDVGNPNGEYKAPYAIIYRNMAILGVEGFSALPQHCLQLCYGFFGFAILANLSRDLSLNNSGKYVPLPMAMAVPFLVGAYFAIDMCVGSLVVFAWHKLNSRKASLMVPAVASGLICGDGLWILPSSILALAKIRPPAPSPLSQSDLQRVHDTPTKTRVAEMSTVGQADIHLGGQGSQMTIRKEILEKVEKWLTACEEESWLEEYNKDDNRYNAARGAHLTLKRAEKARNLVNKMPGMVEALASKTMTWESKRGIEFFYDGIHLLSMLEEYTILH